MGGKRPIVDSAADGCYVSVESNPGARKTGFVGVDKWRGALRIDIAANPVKGEANAELITFFEGIFPESKGRIAISKGSKSRSKRIFIPLAKEKVAKRLGLTDDN